MNRAKKITIAAVSAILTLALVVNPLAAVIVYEAIFSSRHQTAPYLAFNIGDFDSLAVVEVEIEGEHTLAGYKYENPSVIQNGVVIISHGLGGGGHNSYMPIIDFLTDNGYFVFAYDATGNDKSEGNGTRGLPQGIIDLDRAIGKVKDDTEYKDLPIYLIGHSWGAYSVGAVLNRHPEVSGAVMISGFNSSGEMIREGAKDYIGAFLTDITLPYAKLYERIKFGGWAEESVLSGIDGTDAKILIVHSLDDSTVPTSLGFDSYYERYHGSTRVKFKLYEDRGHNYLFYSEAAEEYRNELNEKYLSYVEENGLSHSAEVKMEFFKDNLDKAKCFEPDPELMQLVLNTFS